jgi:hypothetical protein
MARLECTVDHLPYNNKTYGMGDKFNTVSDEDARLLKGFGKAKDAPSRQQFEDKSLTATSTEEIDQASKRSKRYIRRDLQASEKE